MNRGKVYETVSLRLSEDGDRLTTEDVCIEFIHHDEHVSILLNGIDCTNIFRRLLALGDMSPRRKILLCKLERIFNREEYNAIPPLLLKGIVGKGDFQIIRLFGDPEFIKEIRQFPLANTIIDSVSNLTTPSSQESIIYQPSLSDRRKQKHAFKSITAAIKWRVGLIHTYVFCFFEYSIL